MIIKAHAAAIISCYSEKYFKANHSTYSCSPVMSCAFCKWIRKEDSVLNPLRHTRHLKCIFKWTPSPLKVAKPRPQNLHLWFSWLRACVLIPVTLWIPRPGLVPVPSEWTPGTSMFQSISFPWTLLTCFWRS